MHNYNCYLKKRVARKRWIPKTIIFSFSILFKPKFWVVFTVVCGLVILFLEFTLSIRKPVVLQDNEININVAGSGTDTDEIELSAWTPLVEFTDKRQEDGREEEHGREEEEEEEEEEKEKEDQRTKTKVPADVVTMATTNTKKEMSCHLPLLNPFDESILKYIEEPTPIQCSNSTRYPGLFTTDLRSTLIQVDDPEKYGYYFCCYSSFQRADNHKSRVRISGKCEPIKKKKTHIPEHIEFIQISCAKGNSTSSKSSRRLIVDMFGFIRLKPGNFSSDIENSGDEINVSNLKWDPKIKQPQSSGRKVNVVVFGVDAVSHMNFIRVMPRTFKYLTGNLSGIGLWGYTKIGDNTFPNILAATTGLFEKELDTVAHCWNNTDVFDNCPFIWKDFARQGYTTAYGEDAVGLAAFNHHKDGFKHQPTDFYEATLTGHQDDRIGHVKLLSAKACNGPRLGFQVELDFLKKMAVAMDKERRYFQLSWTTSLTHDNLNNGKHGDHILLDTLQWFQNEGYLEDTVLILMSDHGIRCGDIRDTLQGKIEERMPFLYFVFPQWFKEAYPVAVRNVMENKHKLTTPFDLYETFQDLLSLQNIESKKVRQRSSDLKENTKLPRGISLVLEIPARRTCPDADISKHWCVCHSTVSVGAGHIKLVHEAGQRVVETINEMFKEHPECKELELKTILNAQVVDEESLENEDLKSAASAQLNSVSMSTLAKPSVHKEKITLRLSLSVSPSNGTFEATATRATDGDWVVLDGISRINVYGDQSNCVKDYHLKKFCFCPKL